MTAPNAEVTADQVAGFPAEVGQAVRELVGEYEARETQEAQLAKDADKLECLIQAREYQAQGHEDVPPWIETSAAALRPSQLSSSPRPASRFLPDSGGRSSPSLIPASSTRSGSQVGRPAHKLTDRVLQPGSSPRKRTDTDQNRSSIRAAARLRRLATTRDEPALLLT